MQLNYTRQIKRCRSALVTCRSHWYSVSRLTEPIHCSIRATWFCRPDF